MFKVSHPLVLSEQPLARHCFTNNNDYPFQWDLPTGEQMKDVHLCVSLRLLGLPAEEQSALDTMDCCHPHSLANILLHLSPSLSFFVSLLYTYTQEHTWYMHCRTHWLCLISAFFTEWAEHDWRWSHACCQGTWHLWNTDTHPQIQIHTLTHKCDSIFMQPNIQ